MRFPFDALDDQPHEYLCDCCFKPANVFDSRINSVTGKITNIAHWCYRHEHLWQRVIYTVRLYLADAVGLTKR